MKQIEKTTKSSDVVINVDRTKYINGMSNDDILLGAYNELKNQYFNLKLYEPILITVNDNNTYCYAAYITEIAACASHDKLTDSQNEILQNFIYKQNTIINYQTINNMINDCLNKLEIAIKSVRPIYLHYQDEYGNYDLPLRGYQTLKNAINNNINYYTVRIIFLTALKQMIKSK